MEKNLEFLKSWGIQDFKFEVAATTLQILSKTEDSARFFRTDSGVSGKVSRKGYSADSIVSLVADKTTGEQFYLLHPEGEQRVFVVHDTL